MPLLRGEDIILGVSREATRGTFATPTMWVPGRSPSGIKTVQDRVIVKEGRGSKIASTGSEPVMKRAEGDIEMNLKSQSIGFFLLSLLGSVASAAKSAPNTAVYDHTFSLLANNPEHPSLAFGLAQGAQQHYQYRLGAVGEIDINVVPNELVTARAVLMAASEAEHGGSFSPTFSGDDVYFRHQDVSIKFAANVAGLGAASPIKVKSLNVNVANGMRPDQNVSEINPGNMLVTEIVGGGQIEMDQMDKTYHDLFNNNTDRAMQITMVRNDVTIGSSANPGIVFTFPRISFENWTPNRPLEEIVRETLPFRVHQPASGNAVEIVVTNLIANYNAA